MNPKECKNNACSVVTMELDSSLEHS